jgi:hypothetical protein
MKNAEGEDRRNYTSSFEIPCSTFDIHSVHRLRLLGCGLVRDHTPRPGLKETLVAARDPHCELVRILTEAQKQGQ